MSGRAWVEWAIEAGAMLAAALLLALLGPFGSFAMPFGPRLANWLLFAVGGYCFFRPVVWAGEVLAAHTRLPLAAALAIACVVAAAPTSVLVAWTITGMNVGRISLGALAELYPEVLLIGALVTAGLAVIGRRRSPSVPGPVGAPEDETADPLGPAPVDPSTLETLRPRFLDRLPPALGRELLALANEDHYVRAHTPHGSALILMRMRDAVAELEGVEGARVHRGWWVARAAVAEVLRRDRAVALRLVNGLDVPVARASVAELRAAGWLQS